MNRRQTIALVATAVVLVAAVAAAWSLDARASRANEYVVVIARSSGEQLASFDVEQLRALDQTEIVADGKAEEGPTLLAVLEAAGVADFDAVTVQGHGDSR